MENTTNTSSVLSKGIENSLRSWADVTAEIERVAEFEEPSELLYREREGIIDRLQEAQPQNFADLAAMVAVLLSDGEGLTDQAPEILRDHARRLLGLPALGAA